MRPIVFFLIIFIGFDLRNTTAGKQEGEDCRNPKSGEERNLDEGNRAENSDFFFFFFLTTRKEAYLLATYQVIVI